MSVSCDVPLVALEAVGDLLERLRRPEAVRDGGVAVRGHDAGGGGDAAAGMEVLHEGMELGELGRRQDVAATAEVDERGGLDELVLAQVVADLLVADPGVGGLGQVREDVEVGVDLRQVEDRDEQHGGEADGDDDGPPRDRPGEGGEEAARLALVLLPVWSGQNR